METSSWKEAGLSVMVLLAHTILRLVQYPSSTGRYHSGFMRAIRHRTSNWELSGPFQLSFCFHDTHNHTWFKLMSI
jgi:hypothetical protein